MVLKVHVREGQFVQAGEPLFTLDARTDEANLGKAQAQLQKDLAALADAQRQLARSKDLLAQNFISQGAVDTNQALVDSQQAVVAADRAAIDAARAALSYSRIVAPSARAGGRDARVRGQLRAAQRPGAGHHHPARPDRGGLQPAAAQPARCAGLAAQRRRQRARGAARGPRHAHRQAAVRRQRGRRGRRARARQGGVRQQGTEALARRLRRTCAWRCRR